MTTGWSTVLIAGLLWGATLLVFSPVLRADFLNFDDDVYVTSNPDVQRGISPAGMAWAMRSVVCANWHPLTVISHQLDCQIYGLAAWGHHLTNLLLHATTVSLTYLLVRRLTGQNGLSLTMALVWGWHPLRIESVAWVAERKDVLSGCLGMASLWAYVHWVQRRTPLRYGLLAGSFALGLLAKPMLVTLPGLLLLLDFWPLRRADGQAGTVAMRWKLWRPLVLEKLPLVAMAAAAAVVTYQVQSSHGSVRSFELLPLHLRLSNAVLSIATYARQLFWPGSLSIYYPHTLPGWTLPDVILSALALAAMGFGVYGARGRGYPVTGWLWFLGMLVPVIGIVQVGGAGHSDRYTYLPHWGLTWAVVWGARDLLAVAAGSRAVVGRRIALGSALVVVTVCVIDTEWELRFWKNSESLFRRALELRPDNDLALNNLGWALIDSGRAAEALAYLQQAADLQPRQVPPLAGLATAYQMLGRIDESDAAYRRALPLAQDNAELLNNYAWLLATHPVAERRHPAEARRLVRRALELAGRPRSDYLDTLAETFAAESRWTEAIAAEQEALDSVPPRSQLAQEILVRLEGFRRRAEAQRQPQSIDK